MFRSPARSDFLGQNVHRKTRQAARSRRCLKGALFGILIVNPEPRIDASGNGGELLLPLSATQDGALDSSCPDLILASITLGNAFSKRIDHRVKPGDDDLDSYDGSRSNPLTPPAHC